MSLQDWIYSWFKYDSSLLLKLQEDVTKVLQNQKTILSGQEEIMHTLDEVLAEVTAEKTGIDSLVALIAGLKQQLADALSGVTLPAEVQAKVDAVFDGVTANAKEATDALAANTPAAP